VRSALRSGRQPLPGCSLAMSPRGDVDAREGRRERWLVTFVGLQPKEVTYTLDTRAARASHAGLALVELLAERERPDRVVVLATRESAERTWPAVERGLDQAGLAATLRVIEDSADLGAFLKALADVVPSDRGLEILVDLTHGFRHFPLLAYAGLLYLAALRPRVSVAGCFFGLLDTGGETARFLDLRPLVALPEWLFALRLLERHADANPLGELLEAEAADQQLVRRTQDLAKALLWRCPLDAVAPAQTLAGPLERPLRRALRGAGLPGADELATHLRGLFSSYAIEPTAESRARERKGPITSVTLALHARHVSDAFERGDLPAAASLLREWIVSWAWAGDRQPGEESGLEHRARARVGTRLGALVAMNDNLDHQRLLDPEQRRLARLWKCLSEVRNALMHNGMRPQSVLELDAKAAELKREWGEWLLPSTSAPFHVSLQPNGRSGTLLVTPLGKSPDVLGAALDESRPRADRLLVVTSRECAAAISDQVAGRLASDAVECLFFDDPTGGITELEEVERSAERLVARAERVRVNLTGGTTLLGLAVERIARQAERLALPLRRFVLLQRAGEEGSSLVWVDSDTGEEPGRRSGGD